MRLIPSRLQTGISAWTGKYLFRLRTAEEGEVFLPQRRIFIVPTRAGLTFGIMLLVLFLCSINYNLSLGFALTFLLASCAIVGNEGQADRVTFIRPAIVQMQIELRCLTGEYWCGAAG